MTAGEAIGLAGRIEDLLTLLADSDRRLAFPTVRTSRRSPPVTIYYPRISRGERSAEWHKAWARFGAIRQVFGQIMEAWLARYDEIGAGFYLYLGNRRGLKMNQEHRFASLVWGLEAFHRNTEVPVQNERLDAKIDRILGCIPRAKDKAWTERLLRSPRNRHSGHASRGLCAAFLSASAHRRQTRSVIVEPAFATTCRTSAAPA